MNRENGDVSQVWSEKKVPKNWDLIFGWIPNKKTHNHNSSIAYRNLVFYLLKWASQSLKNRAILIQIDNTWLKNNKLQYLDIATNFTKQKVPWK